LSNVRLLQSALLVLLSTAARTRVVTNDLSASGRGLDVPLETAPSGPGDQTAGRIV
jgi:hypothetical protein